MGEGARMPSGLFSAQTSAEVWILHNRLTGVLTEFPVDIGVLDWAIRFAEFDPPVEKRASPAYVGRFTSGAVTHFRFEDGVRVA